MTMSRPFWVIAHRWAGLTIALFLVVAGVTGALLAFIEDLDPQFSREVHFVSPPTAGAMHLEPLKLREKVLASHPGSVIDYLPLHVEPGRSLKLGIERIDSKSGQLTAWSSDADEFFVDPYTGAIVGARKWGDITQGAINLMPFIYRLHYSFASGSVGVYAFGIAALIWTLDCFIGFYLTFPARRRNDRTEVVPTARSWWSRWKPSWLVRWGGGSYKLTFDLHRSSGLWLWPLLLAFAWSGVAFNLTEVYDPVMKLFGRERLQDGVAELATLRHQPKLEFTRAATYAHELAQQEAKRHGFSLEQGSDDGLWYRPDYGVYVYYFRTDRDFTHRESGSRLIFDGDSGQLVKLVLPQSQNGANTFTNWIMALHMATVWGLPYRIAVSVLGLLVTLLAATGVLIWVKKRRARTLVAAKFSRNGTGHGFEFHTDPVASLRSD